ncbi:hypothetical protein C8Q78DRAFT_1007562 [Trametes maxima]|nr:hypothetical protein C8Q78DRAFT_1007562 [Trametes maxima]
MSPFRARGPLQRRPPSAPSAICLLSCAFSPSAACDRDARPHRIGFSAFFASCVTPLRPAPSHPPGMCTSRPRLVASIPRVPLHDALPRRAALSWPPLSRAIFPAVPRPLFVPPKGGPCAETNILARSPVATGGWGVYASEKFQAPADFDHNTAGRALRGCGRTRITAELRARGRVAALRRYLQDKRIYAMRRQQQQRALPVDRGAGSNVIDVKEKMRGNGKDGIPERRCACWLCTLGSGSPVLSAQAFLRDSRWRQSAWVYPRALSTEAPAQALALWDIVLGGSCPTRTQQLQRDERGTSNILKPREWIVMEVVCARRPVATSAPAPARRRNDGIRTGYVAFAGDQETKKKEEREKEIKKEERPLPYPSHVLQLHTHPRPPTPHIDTPGPMQGRSRNKNPQRKPPPPMPLTSRRPLAKGPRSSSTRQRRRRCKLLSIRVFL